MVNVHKAQKWSERFELTKKKLATVSPKLVATFPKTPTKNQTFLLETRTKVKTL